MSTSPLPDESSADAPAPRVGPTTASPEPTISPEPTASPEPTISPEPTTASPQSGLPADLQGGSGAGEDWWSILGVLDARRQRALTERDPAALADYLVPGSPAWRADSGLIAEMQGQDLRPVGLETHLIAIEGVEMGGPAVAPIDGGSSEDGGRSPSAGAGPAMERATAVLVDSRSGYSLVDAQGVVVQVVDSPGTQRWQVTLARTAGSRPPPAHASALGIDEQQAEGLSPSPLPPEDGDRGWRIAEVSPMS